MTGMKLYETVEALGTVNAWIDEHADELLASGGELSPELAQLLEQAEGDFAEKVERVALKVRSLLAEGDAIKVEEVRLAQRRKSREHAAESLKQYLQHALDMAGETKVTGTLVTVAIQKNPPSVRGLVDESQLAEWAQQGSAFVTIIPETYALDRKAILTAHKGGLEIPAGLTVEQSASVRIR